MKLLGLFHITVSREGLDEQLGDEYLRAFREGRQYEAEKRAQHTAEHCHDVAYVEGMLAGVEVCAQAGHTTQPSKDGDADNARYWVGYAEGARDGRASRNSGTWPSTGARPRNAGRRAHPHLNLVHP